MTGDGTPLRLSRRSMLIVGAMAGTAVVGGLLAMQGTRGPRLQDPITGDELPTVPAPGPTDEPVEIVYCAGWDPAARAPVTPMSESVARAQDAAGAQYAAVLVVGGVARAVVEVCWSLHHAEVWHIDEAGRRYRGVAYRRWPDGRLRVFEVRGWTYPSPDAPERHGDNPTFQARVRRTATASVETISIDAELPGGGKLHTTRDWQNWPEPQRPPDDVDIEGWPELAGMLGRVSVRPGPSTVPTTFPWRPPQPLRPRHLDQILKQGARFRTKDGELRTVKRISAGPIRLPSGRLVVGDPSWLDASTAAQADRVPPGEYLVDVFQLTETGVTAACRVTIADAPITSWHLALRDGDHELDLGDGEFVGNPVETATHALVDQTGVTAYKLPDIDAATAGDAAFHRLSSGPTDLVIVPGWSDGATPVWLGRTEDGAVGCFVVDLQVPDLADAEPA